MQRPVTINTGSSWQGLERLRLGLAAPVLPKHRDRLRRSAHWGLARYLLSFSATSLRLPWRPAALRSALLGLLLLPLGVAAAPTDLDAGFAGGERFNPLLSDDPFFTRFDGRALAVDFSGLTYVVGGANNPEMGIVAIFRQNGSLNTDFNGGTAVIANARFDDLLLFPDGSLLVCGLSRISQVDTRWLVARFRPDLSLDTTFGGSGVVIGEQASQSSCSAIEQLSDGRIILTGSYRHGTQQRGFVSVLLSNGLLDPAFGGTGTVFPYDPFYQAYPPGGHLAEGLDGRIWLTAAQQQAGPNNQLLRFVFRIDGNGQVSPQTNSASQVFHAPEPNAAGRWQVDPYGRPHLAYQSGQAADALVPFTRLTVTAQRSSITGQFDGRWELAEFNSALASNLDGYEFADVAQTPNDRLLVAGIFRSQQPPARARIALVRVRPDPLGRDPSFYTPGPAQAFLHQPAGQPVGGVAPYPRVRGVAIGRDGRITVLSRLSSGQNGITLTRFIGDTLVTLGEYVPSALSFDTAQARPDTLTESEPRTISGLGPDARVPLLVLSGEYQLNNGSWSRHPTYVVNGDQLRLRTRSSSTPNASRTVTALIGGVRANNSWNTIGDRVTAQFSVISSLPTLDGNRCSDGGLNTNCSAPIPDDGTVLSSKINLVYASQFSCNFIKSVRVGLDIDHPRVGDLIISLLDPNYSFVIGDNPAVVSLINRPTAGLGQPAGSCQGADILAHLSDEGQALVDHACQSNSQPSLSGSLRPHRDLAKLTGRPGTGNNGNSNQAVWELVIRDPVAGQAGQLNNWSIDVQCSDTPVTKSDLAVTAQVVSPALVGLPNTQFYWEIENLGPDDTNGAAVTFNAQLPQGANKGFAEQIWGCDAETENTSCVVSPGLCPVEPCTSPVIRAFPQLPVGGKVRVWVVGQPHPDITEVGAAMSVTGGVWINPNVIIGLPVGVDPDSSNNQASVPLPLFHMTDIQAEQLNVSWLGGNSVQITARFGNHYPVFAPDTETRLTLPAGFSISQVTCHHQGAACTGSLNGVGSNEIVLGNQPMMAEATQYRLTATASFAGALPPAGQAVLTSRLIPGPTVFDPVPENDSLSVPIPQSQSDRIFHDRFDNP